MRVSSSRRLKFQLMDQSDADSLFELDQNPEVMRYVNGGKPTSKKDLEQRHIPRLLSYLNPQQGWGLWKVMRKDTNEYIGWILVRPMHFFSNQPEYNNLEIGWRFFQSSWGKGFATEAASRFVEAFEIASDAGEIEPVARISAIAMPENIASIAVMKKLGLKYLRTTLHCEPSGDVEVVYYQKQLTEHC